MDIQRLPSLGGVRKSGREKSRIKLTSVRGCLSVATQLSLCLINPWAFCYGTIGEMHLLQTRMMMQ
jgi:hypothetical protein